MMIYRVRLHRYPDDSVIITSKEELKHLHTKQYHDYVKDVFVEHQNCMGQDPEEAEDAFNDQDFKTIEKFLVKSGYDLENDFKYFSS